MLARPRLAGLPALDSQAPPIVAHGQRACRHPRLERDFDVAGACMAHDVAQRLLRHPEEAQRRVRGDLRGYVAGVEVHADGLLPGDAIALHPQRRDQSQIIDHRRMQAIRQRVHVLAQADELWRIVSSAVPRAVAASALQLGGLDGKAASRCVTSSCSSRASRRRSSSCAVRMRPPRCRPPARRAGAGRAARATRRSARLATISTARSQRLRSGAGPKARAAGSESRCRSAVVPGRSSSARARASRRPVLDADDLELRLR